MIIIESRLDNVILVKHCQGSPGGKVKKYLMSFYVFTVGSHRGMAECERPCNAQQTSVDTLRNMLGEKGECHSVVLDFYCQKLLRYSYIDTFAGAPTIPAHRQIMLGAI